MTYSPGATALLIVDILTDAVSAHSRWAYRKQLKDSLDRLEEVALDHGGERIERYGDCLVARLPSPPATVQAAADCLRQREEIGVPVRLYLHFADLDLVRRETLSRQPGLATLLVSNPGQPGAFASGQFLQALSPELRHQLAGLRNLQGAESAPAAKEFARLLGAEVTPTAPATEMPANARGGGLPPAMPGHLESTVPPEKNVSVTREPADLTNILDTISREVPSPAMCAAELHIRHRGADYVLDQDRTRIQIGRGLENDIVINSRYVSRHHARIEFLHGRFEFVNLSPNGSCIQPQAEAEIVCTERFRLFGAGAIRLGTHFEEEDEDIIRYATA